MDFQSFQRTLTETMCNLRLQLSQQRQEKFFFENLGLQETEDLGDEHFVFQGQCMVLGDSGVGKTSLVNSLTGKPFDSRQPKTHGVSQSLVDETWKSLDLKDLVFGDLWGFLNYGEVATVLIGTRTETSAIVVRPFLVWKTGFWIMLCFFLLCIIQTVFIRLQEFPLGMSSFYFSFMYMTFFFKLSPAYVFHFTGNRCRRFILATLSFIFVSRGVVIGSYLALVVCYWDERYAEFANIRAVLLLVTIITGFGLATLFRLIGPISMSHGNNRQHYSYASQLVIENKLSMMTFLVCRLLLSISVGLIFGFASASIGRVSLKEYFYICPFYIAPFAWQFPLEFMELTWHLLLPPTLDASWEVCALLIVVHYYHLKLAWSSRCLYFAIFFPALVFYTLYVELFCFHEVVPGNLQSPNNLITLVVGNARMTDEKRLKGALDAKFSSLKLKILDFAGDKEYCAYHHIFLRSDAIYIMVFNMVDMVENHFRNINAKLQRLQFWFESICCHLPSKVPVFLVGTHRATINKNYIKTLDKHLRANLWNSHCDDLVVNDCEDLIFFPVENSIGQNDVGVQFLQKEIVSTAEHCKQTIGRGIPLTWIRVQDAIISLQEKTDAKFCITLEEFPSAFDDFVCNSYMYSIDTLKYFHKKGLIIYLDKTQDLDLSNWVLLKPEILVDIIIQLVTPPPERNQKRGMRHDWNLLQTKGMLTRSLLARIISNVKENIDAMTAFLEEYDLICPLVNKEVPISCPKACEPTHFVPSLLPMSVDGNVPVWHDDDTDKELYVFFNKFLPDPLFHRLLSRAHKNSKVEFPNGQTVLYRDAGKFFMNAWTPYRLKLMKEQKMIGVTFSCSHNNAMKPSDMLCQVFSMVGGICTRDFPSVSFHCGPACPSLTCPGHQDDYLMSPSSEVDQDTRRYHVYNVMPGRQGDRITFLYCENHSFDTELDEWIP